MAKIILILIFLFLAIAARSVLSKNNLLSQILPTNTPTSALPTAPVSPTINPSLTPLPTTIVPSDVITPIMPATVTPTPNIADSPITTPTPPISISPFTVPQNPLTVTSITPTPTNQPISFRFQLPLSYLFQGNPQQFYGQSYISQKTALIITLIAGGFILSGLIALKL